MKARGLSLHELVVIRFLIDLFNEKSPRKIARELG